MISSTIPDDLIAQVKKLSAKQLLFLLNLINLILRESERESNIINSLSDSLGDPPEKNPNREMLKTLQSCGVYLATAAQLVSEHSDNYITRHLAYFQHARKTGIARGPGWLVQSISNNWPAPPGYEPPYQPPAPVAYSDPEPDPLDPDPGDPLDPSLLLPAGRGTIAQAWQSVASNLGEQVSPQARQYLANAFPQSYDPEDGVLVIVAPDSYARDWLQSRCASTLRNQLVGFACRQVDVRFISGGD